jgi:heparan-alpha-glucosaminide N-acetyltransferase
LNSGGYFHGINSLTYGVDMKRIRWLGILQVHRFLN